GGGCRRRRGAGRLGRGGGGAGIGGCVGGGARGARPGGGGGIRLRTRAQTGRSGDQRATDEGQRLDAKGRHGGFLERETKVVKRRGTSSRMQKASGRAHVAQLPVLPDQDGEPVAQDRMRQRSHHLDVGVQV